MEKCLKKAICEWDIENWSRAIDDFDAVVVDSSNKEVMVLDIGGRNGGLSLYWALRGAYVVCSEIHDKAFEKAKALHIEYGVSNKIRYEVVNALEIDYENYFDIITFKSVMGGVGYDNNYLNQKIMMEQCYKALRPGGRLCFVENLTGSKMHMFLRKKLRKWGSRWRYVKLNEFDDLLKCFKIDTMNAYGFLGILGRNKVLNWILSGLDRVFDRFIRCDNRYIVSVIATKE